MSAAQPQPEAGTAAPSAVQSIGRFFFRFRDALTPIGLVVLLLATRPQQLFGSAAANFWMDFIGVLVAATGQALRATVIGYAYIVRGGANKRLAAPKLVCEGFYAHSRNPMYLGNFMLLAGLAIIYNSLWVYLIGLPLFYGGLLSIVKAEEDFLAREFGDDYARYCRTTNRFLPRLAGMRDTLGQMHFDWKRVLRKEYGTTFAWTSTALALLAWERFYRGGRVVLPQLLPFLAAWMIIFAAWGVVRFLKKTGRLKSAD